MQSPCIREMEQVCPSGFCCPSPFLTLAEHSAQNSKSRSSSATSRRDFVSITASSFFPNIRFTNIESLPSLEAAFVQFHRAYQQYSETSQVDQIRAEEYYHLSQLNSVCFDYIGVGLFSYIQVDFQALETASTSPPKPLSALQDSDIPFFAVSYKSVNLKTRLLRGGQESDLEFAIRRRITDFLNISENDYSMIFAGSRSAAFRSLANSYPFQSHEKLLTLYDYESEAVEAMARSAEKRGAHVMSAEFSWPRLKIHSANLKKMLIGSKKKKKGLFVFPVHSRITGARYPYLWMKLAQENGWHVLLDACAVGPKDMDTFGLSLFQPDFIVCSFYNVFAENPSGFGCLFVKKSTIPILEDDTMTTGIASLVPAKNLFQSPGESSGTETELQQAFKQKGSEIAETERSNQKENTEVGENRKTEIECRGLDHVDSLGLVITTRRTRYLINWLINALMKLQHPSPKEEIPLVRIYGPKVKFDRAPALAFGVLDWKGEKIEPLLVRKIAERNNISLSCGFLHRIWFSDKYQEEKERVVERKTSKEMALRGNNKRDEDRFGISVVTAAVCFLSNFEDVYRLWAFVAKFLDADFVEKERWRDAAYSQKALEI